MKLLGLFWVIVYFLYVCMVLLRLLVLYDLCLSFLLMVFLLVHWGLVIGRQGFLILAGYSILVVSSHLQV